MYVKYFAGVGSRKTPRNILEIMIRLGRTLTDLGYSLSSGDAHGADRAFHYGAMQSKNYSNTSPRIYIPGKYFRGTNADGKVFINSLEIKDVRERQLEILKGAVPHFDNLKGISLELHARNVFQILGSDLETPVEMVFLYTNIDKKGVKKGGTTTAYNIAVENNIPLIKNLAEPDDLEFTLKWLEENELDYPYKDVFWEDILSINEMYKVEEDGVTHYNVYSKGKTELGVLLSNFARTPFEHPQHGDFQSIEGYYYWLLTGKKHDFLRNLWGINAKIEGSKLDKVPYKDFLEEVKEGINLKIRQNKHLKTLLLESKLLPLTHYYVYGDKNPKLVAPKNSEWLIRHLGDTWLKLVQHFEEWKSLG